MVKPAGAYGGNRFIIPLSGQSRRSRSRQYCRFFSKTRNIYWLFRRGDSLIFRQPLSLAKKSPCLKEDQKNSRGVSKEGCKRPWILPSRQQRIPAGSPPRHTHRPGTNILMHLILSWFRSTGQIVSSLIWISKILGRGLVKDIGALRGNRMKRQQASWIAISALYIRWGTQQMQTNAPRGNIQSRPEITPSTPPFHPSC